MSTGFQLRTANDFRFIANREQVTLFNAAGSQVCVVNYAKRLMQNLAERAPSNGQYLYVPIDWRLPGVNVTQAVQPGWIIKDAAAIAYVVQDVDPPGTYLGTYNCSCLSLMAMGRTITWHLPTNTTDDFTSPLTDQTQTLMPVPCAIQNMTEDAIIFQQGVQGTVRRYQIWFIGDATLNEGTIGVDDQGITYTVESVRNRSQISELIEVVCVVQP